MIIEDFETAGHDFAFVEYHGSDDYETTESAARLSYYSCEYYPETWIDGQQIPMDNWDDDAMMLDWYNTRMATQSNFSIGISETHTGSDYTATITLTKEAEFTNTNMVLRVVVVESHIPEAWQTVDELNYVSRDLIPDASGSSVSFASGDIQNYNLNFSIGAGWDKDNCQLVAFIQDEDTKEVLQAEVISLASATYATDAQMFEITSPVGNYCGESIAPQVRIKNKGSNNLTSLEINYSVNGGAINTYNWSGDLLFNTSTVVTLPAVSFTPLAENTLTVSCTNPNGITDENTENNEVTGTFDFSDYSTETLTFEILTDTYGSESSWDLKNSAGTIIAEGSGYSNSTYYSEEITVPATDCYTLGMYDSYGDGIYSPGYYRLKDQEGNIIVEGGVDVGSEEITNFHVNINVSVTEITPGMPEIYPIPSGGAVYLKTNGVYPFTVYGLTGNIVMKSQTKSGVSAIDFSDFSDGTYLIMINLPEKVFTQRIVISK